MNNTRSSGSLRLCGLVLLGLAMLLACHREQPPSPTDPYRDVPARDRESLRSAVQQFADFQRTGNFEKMYEVLEEPKESKDKFLRRRTQATANLQEFYPIHAAWIPEYWTITGCGVFAFSPDGSRKGLVASTRAKLSGDKWTLVPIGIEVFPEQPGHVKRCVPPR